MNTSSIGLGLAALGRPEYINIGEKPQVDKTEISFKQNAFKVLDFAYQKGVRYFDTAPSYGKGEQFLREWSDLHSHPDVVLGTKWGYTYVADWQLGYSGPHEIKEHSLDKLVEQWQESKKLLPRLQMYQIHSATFESGVLENRSVLEKLHRIKKESGVKIGLTTSGDEQKNVIEKALGISVAGEGLFDGFQTTFNMLEQDALSVLRKAKQKGKIIIIKEALANGRLFPNKKYAHYGSLYQTMNGMASHYKVGVDAIALRYCWEALKPDIILSGASDRRQLAQNLKAVSFRLSPAHLALLEAEKVSSSYYWEERSRLAWD